MLVASFSWCTSRCTAENFNFKSIVWTNRLLIIMKQIKGGYDSTLTGQSKRGLSGYGSVKNRKTGNTEFLFVKNDNFN